MDSQRCDECGVTKPTDLEQLSAAEAMAFLTRVLTLVQEQRRSDNSLALLPGAIKHTRTLVTWVRAIALSKTRRTMAKTNGDGRGERNPVLMYGYRNTNENS
ncbi:hypothetical protein C8Q70DRAFT_1023206 [Cubamyces menziesii]|nr:hypothetical protein C8Q70DRAFT_1023206 [Cubamyces menziesii]